MAKQGNPFTIQDAYPDWQKPEWPKPDAHLQEYVYLVGKVTEYPAFEVQGIFGDSHLASELCMRHNTKDCALWFVMPLEFNIEAPEETVVNRNSYYPIRVELKRRA